MSRNDDYNYFDFDNFDDDKRNVYRRSHPQGRTTQRRPASYGNKRPVYNTSRNNRRNYRRHSRRTRNRIMIVSLGIAIIVLLIVLLSVMIKGCSGNSEQTNATIPTGTKSVSEATADTAKYSGLSQELRPDYFVTPSIDDDNSNGESVYGVYVWQKTGFELFGSDDAKAKKYADTINSFANKFKAGTTIYDMVVPNHTEMGLPQRLKDSDAQSGSQAENIKAIYSYLSDEIVAVNSYNYLANHNKEYIYFKSDHHWTGLGAYYAYAAFADSTNQKVLSLESCTENTIENFTGSFAAYSSAIDSDTVHYWKFPYDVTMSIKHSDGTADEYTSPYYEYAEGGTNTYGLFIMGDNQDSGLTVLTSSSENAETGKKIAVVKESYGNAFVPYLTYNYEEVHVVDFRYFNQNLSTYCAENEIDEVLFLNGVMSANTQIQLDSMSNMFN